MRNLYQKNHGLPGLGIKAQQGEKGEKGTGIYFGFINEFFDYNYIELDSSIRVAKQKNLLSYYTGAEKIENELTKTLRSIMMLQESYPNLKADQSFLSLQSELSSIETDVQSARKYYNGTARDLNTFVETFPNNIIGNFLSFKTAKFFDADDQVHTVPEVKF